jgi:hypothetical protein
MEALATYTGILQCWNSFDLREDGGVPTAKLVVWPDRLEMTTRGVLKLVFRPRTIPRERVQLIRPLLAEHPAHRVIWAVNPLARGLQLINLVVSAPKEQRIDTGNIHYVLGVRSPGTADILNVFEGAGFPVSRAPLRLTKLNIGGELNYLDLMNRPGRS